ncbi:MAG TPA: cistern family PEP-CTERM protein [Pyrinomonadaceae bacterium]
MSRFRRFLITLSAVGILAVVSATAHADTITVVGVDSGNFSTATVVCEFNAQTNTFTFTITNTSHITQPGSTSTITGIGFDLPPLGNASASGLNGFTGMQAPSLSSNFVFSDADLGNVPHGFNTAVLDFGFLTGNSGNFNSGSVNDGLLPGESASFTVSGAAFAGFTETEICNAIFVRFQNVPAEGGSGGSDVGTPGTEIPEPSTMLLLGTALVGLGGVVRRRFKGNQ